LKSKKVSWAQNCGEEVIDENCEMKKFEVSYNARNVAIKEAYFGNKVIIKNPNPGAKENAASLARNQELEQRNQVKIIFHSLDPFHPDSRPFSHDHETSNLAPPVDQK